MMLWHLSKYSSVRFIFGPFSLEVPGDNEVIKKVDNLLNFSKIFITFRTKLFYPNHETQTIQELPGII